MEPKVLPLQSAIFSSNMLILIVVRFSPIEW